MLTATTVVPMMTPEQFELVNEYALNPSLFSSITTNSSGFTDDTID